jgi:hypothetical protein
MRIAFTIVLNGFKHLLHNNFYENMIKNFDHWIIVEGVANPGGSTNWCKPIPDIFHSNFCSVDGTTEFLDKYVNAKIRVLRPVDRPWDSKDQQVNAAISEIKRITDKCFLWQIDVDEQWDAKDLDAAEQLLIQKEGKTGCFLCDYYVGPNQKVIGEWGEGRRVPYRRLWAWFGEEFEKHEPPTLKGKNGPGLLLPQRFKHYAYYYEEDVIFKEVYYQGYEGLHERWLKVQENRSTMDIKALLGDKVWWSNTQTYIIYENNGC